MAATAVARGKPSVPVGAPEDPRTAALQRSNRELALQNGRLVEQVGQLAAENASLTHMSSCLAATRRVREEEQVREAAKLQQDLRQAGEERRALRAELAARQEIIKYLEEKVREAKQQLKEQDALKPHALKFDSVGDASSQQDSFKVVEIQQQLKEQDALKPHALKFDSVGHASSQQDSFKVWPSPEGAGDSIATGLHEQPRGLPQLVMLSDGIGQMRMRGTQPMARQPQREGREGGMATEADSSETVSDSEGFRANQENEPGPAADTASPPALPHGCWGPAAGRPSPAQNQAEQLAAAEQATAPAADGAGGPSITNTRVRLTPQHAEPSDGDDGVNCLPTTDLRSSSRSRRQVNYTLPGLRAKLRQGDDFTFGDPVARPQSVVKKKGAARTKPRAKLAT